MKSRKKIAVGLLCLTVAFLLSACGGNGEEPTAEVFGTTEVAATENTVETTEETTEAPTEPLTRQVEELRVGMIFYGSQEDDSLLMKSLLGEMYEETDAIGMDREQVMVQYNSREADWTQIEESILACVDSGCQLILGCAREYEAVIAAIAEEYPEIMFACVGSQLYNGMNSGTFMIDVGAAQYLCGAMAGLLTNTDRVGFVAAKDSSEPQVTDAVNAFAYGVWSTNQNAVVDVAVIGKWYLPGAEAYGRQYLEDLGCAPIGSYTDGSIGDLTYQWQQYFSMKLNQIIQKEVIGETWCGDYYGGGVTCENTADLPDYVWGELAQWGTLMEELPEESAEKETVAEDPVVEEPETEEPAVEETSEGSVEETLAEDVNTTEETIEEETVGEEPVPEETTAPYEIPEIKTDRETGYLPNVRIHEIDWEE